MLRFAVRGRTLADLEKLAHPSAVVGGTSEAIAWAFHDTQTYVDNTTLNLQFFTQTAANRQLSNLTQGGALPTPQYFEIYGFMFDILQPAAALSQADAQALTMGNGVAGQGGPTFTFTYSDKTYGPWALSLLHGTGGVSGFGYTTVAATGAEYANNSQPDGGFYQDGAIVLAPNESFSATITWPAVVDIAANRDIRVTMAGVLHRKVL